MKPGDKFPIHLNEWAVAEAVVIDIEDGKVTLDIPQTRVVMGVKTSLDDLPETVPDKEYRILDDKKPAVVPQVQPQAQNSPGTESVSTNVTVTPNQTASTATPAPVQEIEVQSTGAHVPADAIGDGLANVPLKEME